ncbi:MAG TPA: polyribonucleotide nucleotidyltransferase [bacterium]|nr:polyribonucleotide nucleotidyltransferase [bacterium]
MIISKSIEIEGKTLTIETGRLARQADGAVVVQYGDTVVLVTAVASRKPAEYRGFFPLSVEYREKTYAIGKIPGGFFKREGRPQEKEILSARLIDRPIRPLLPMEFMYEVQIVVTVLSSDREHDADVLGIIGASAALSISDIPFQGPIAAVRVGRVDERYVLNASFSDLTKGDMNVVVAASEQALAMVEGESREISEEDMVESLEFGHEAIKKIIALQNELIKEAGRSKRPLLPIEVDTGLVQKVREIAIRKLPEVLEIHPKMERREAFENLKRVIFDSVAEDYPGQEIFIEETIHEVEKELVRKMVLDEKRRIGNRGYDDIRTIDCQIGVLPRTHGSALFTRGETQSLTVVTLGTRVDEQKIENLEGESWKSYMLHYNFPPFSVGEVRFFRGTSRREVGHGNLAERALKPVIPADEVFPYTIRIVSDILESNGSSSMATVCAGSLALMDAGVPVKSAVAGVAMGLIKEKDQVAVLTDILGDEDHLGDMDFKVAGTRSGITSFQMDIKIEGISSDLLRQALDKAQKARLKILDIMDSVIKIHKDDISPYAPRIFSMKIDIDDIGAVIGPGGKMIREIVDKTGAEVNIEDDGTIQIASADQQSCMAAMELIKSIVQKPEIGKVYKGKVKKITNFGAFIEILPGKEGLLHISEIAPHRVNRVEDHLRVGQEIEVKLMKINPEGKLDLSHKVLQKTDSER